MATRIRNPTPAHPPRRDLRKRLARAEHGRQNRNMRTIARFLTIGLIVPSVALAQRGRGAGLPRSSDGPYGALSYRFIGPPGNRVISVAGIPGNSATYYIGA